MAKVKCYSPLGVEEMKEPVDAKECVESCGYTMEPVEPSDPVVEESEVMSEKEVSEEASQGHGESKRGRRRNK